eukprot:3974305-Pyramimonas_sp.AAC.1
MRRAGPITSQAQLDMHNGNKRRLEFIGDAWSAGHSVQTEAVTIEEGQFSAHATLRSKCPRPNTE